MSEFANALLYFLAAAFFQNLVLTTGIGTALALRLTRRPENRITFAVCLLVFSVATVLCFHPIDHALGTGETAKLLRPVILIAISATWFLLATGILKLAAPRLYNNVRALLPYAAINTVVTGVGLIANHQFQAGLAVSVGLAAGASIGFFLVFLLLGEGIDRMSHPDMPKAFAGLPSQLLYLGIIALALCGFAADISFI